MDRGDRLSSQRPEVDGTGTKINTDHPAAPGFVTEAVAVHEGAVYVAGSDYEAAPGRLLVFRDVGGDWEQVGQTVTDPADHPYGRAEKLFVIGPDDIWTFKPLMGVFHFDGTDWTRVLGRDDAAGIPLDVGPWNPVDGGELWVASTGEVLFAVGDKGVVQHVDGAWLALPGLADAGEGYAHFWGSRLDNLWLYSRAKGVIRNGPGGWSSIDPGVGQVSSVHGAANIVWAAGTGGARFIDLGE